MPWEKVISAFIVNLIEAGSKHSAILFSGPSAINKDIVSVLRSPEFLGESDEKPFRPTYVTEPIRVFVLNYLAHELGTTIAEPFKRVIDVVHSEHDAQVA